MAKQKLVPSMPLVQNEEQFRLLKILHCRWMLQHKPYLANLTIDHRFLRLPKSHEKK
jgi:hypothetical protein